MVLDVKKHIEKQFPFLRKSKSIVAVSGGIDSVVLTHILYQLGYSIGLAHVNFNLRGIDSDQDQKFVENLAKKLEIPVFIHQADTKVYAKNHKKSIQMAARDIRYKWFEELRSAEGYAYVLTAHHFDDWIESFFINLSRGTGIDGLTGIPEINTKVIRPLLPFDRPSILAYAKDNKLVWREDRSNAATQYLRNKIRHTLIPVLKNINPAYRKTFLKTQKHLSESKELIADYIELIKPTLISEKNDGLQINIEEILNTPHSNAVLYQLLKDYGFTQWDDIYQLPKAQTGRIVYSDTHFLLKDRSNLKLGVLSQSPTFSQKVKIGSSFQLLDTRYSVQSLPKPANVIYDNTFEVQFDKASVTFPLFVRKWKEGDYFYPLGMQGRKKISDFLIDQKVSRDQKEKIYLLCDADDRIIWVVGMRLDNRFKITENTTEILKITTDDKKKS